MKKRTAEQIEEICRELGTYDYEDVYDKVHERCHGDPPYPREVQHLILQFSESIGSKWKPVGQGKVLRCREFTVFRYARPRVLKGVDITGQGVRR